MPIIRNNLNNRMLIHLKDGKTIDLLEKNAVEITDDDLSSSHLQDLIQRGFVIKEKEAKDDIKKENEVNEDLCKEIKVKTETDDKSEPKKSSNTKKGK